MKRQKLWLGRLGWFLALWLGSVMALALLAYGIRWLIRPTVAHNTASVVTCVLLCERAFNCEKCFEAVLPG